MSFPVEAAPPIAYYQTGTTFNFTLNSFILAIEKFYIRQNALDTFAIKQKILRNIILILSKLQLVLFQ